uniref:protein-serine/threonine phosphatase n=1 Tax=Rhizochromulina marina TaxID=1034831 RepID=A0A7S2SJK7_9STRA|mmetsp:Transcript_30302/g.88240  ORF Transcript_30302/g.88240 Transcript_30302/m.88240 type:complete len:626 (+) Transcript_30302:242-2119(+)
METCEPEHTMQDFMDEGTPSLRLTVTVPKVKSMAELELDVDKDSVRLSERHKRYALDLKLPKAVTPGATKATFRKKKHQLVVTMPCAGGDGLILPPAPLRHRDSMENLQGLNSLPPPRRGSADAPEPLEFKSAAGDEKQRADQLKVEGNQLLAEGHYMAAVEKYTDAIDLAPTAIYFANRASAYLKIEMYAMAVEDATMAIDLDPTYVKGYYRRGTAHLASAKPELALPDFEAALQLCPSSKEAKLHLKACQEILKRQPTGEEEMADFDARGPASSSNASFGPLGGFPAPEDIEVEETYHGPRIPEGDAKPSPEFALELLDFLRDQNLLHKRYVVKILLAVRDQLAASPSLIDIELPKTESPVVTVCGDTHGQFYDLLHIFELNGTPSPENPYVFNGDFVDRGSFSVEVALALLTFKVVYPGGLYLTRGNHESRNCNAMYGFEGEVNTKYDQQVMALFTDVFNLLPLASCIEKQVFVVHGGLFDRDGVTLDEIRAIDRYREPPIEGLMCDMLWSDPQEMVGRAPSKRGVSCMFGPDVTERFLEDNGLKLLIRSHEVKPEGYEVMHYGKCITVFSAPNYCDQMGNKGAFIRFGPDMEPQFTSYDAVPHPDIPPMAYQMPSMSMFSF